MTEPSYEGAVAPERTWALSRGPVRLSLHEWGDPEGEPLLLTHGMWDHGRAFDVLAPLLCERYRVIALDARGHGDSSWAAAYYWPDDIEDICAVVESLGRPVHLVGHSRGASQATDATALVPDRVRSIVNMDGFGPPREMKPRPGMPETHHGRFAMFLDRRREAAGRKHRPAETLEELAQRRKRANERLSLPWLRYFTYHGARRDADGYRWKSDPLLGMGFGAFKPEWIAPFWRHVKAPMLAMVGTEPDFYGPCELDLLDERVEHVQSVERVVVQGAGHFVHMERPQETARHILDFLGGL